MAKLTSVLVFMALFAVAGLAQRTVTGTVTDGAEPLVGVSVVVKGSAIGTITDVAGMFSIQVPEGATKLIFRYVGYTPLEIEVGASNIVDAVLKPNTTALKEVIVTGHTTDLRSDVTSAITIVGDKSIEGLPVQSLDRAIQGKAAGVMITVGSGAPGGEATIRVRGGSSLNAGNKPLVIVDGVEVGDVVSPVCNCAASTNPLNSISPNDIESISILKDGNAEYGAQGANGAVLVTTKRGSREGKPQYSFSYMEGVAQPGKLYQMMNSQQFAAIKAQSYLNSGLDVSTAWELYGNPNDPNLPNYNWADEMFRRNASQRTLDFSARGGSKNIDYYSAFSYNKHEGQTLRNEWERYSWRINLNTDLSDKLSVALRNSLARIQNDNGPFEGEPYRAGPIAGAFLNYSYTGARDENGDYIPEWWNQLQQLNHLDKGSTTLQNVGSLAVTYKILPNLTAHTLAGIHLVNTEDIMLMKDWPNYGDSWPQNAHWNWLTTANNWNVYSTLKYNFSAGPSHKFTALAGFEHRNEYYKTIESFGLLQNSGFGNPGGGSSYTTTSNNLRQGAFSTLKYGFRDKYLVNATLRYDGSSRFGVNNRWGLFYSGSAAWRVRAEDFMADAYWLDELKLRASYGSTGNSQFPDYGALGAYQPANGYFGPAQSLSALINDRLRWETSEHLDLGLDFAILDSRIYGQLDFWQKNNRQLLMPTVLPMEAGISNPNITINAGNVQYRGIDLSLSAVLIKTAHFRWSVGGNLALQKNELKQLLGGQDTIRVGGGGWLPANYAYLIVGQPMFLLPVVEYAGVNPANGRAMAYDKNGVPTYTPGPEDLRYREVGPGPYYGGFWTEFSYRGFTLSGFFQFQADSKGGTLVQDLFYLYNTGSGSVYPRATNQLSIASNYWREPGDLTNLHKPIEGGVIEGVNQANFNLRSNMDYYAQSTQFFSDASYLRLKELKLGYRFPQRWADRMRVNNLVVYVQGLNVLTWTKYAGLDPEVNYSRKTYSGSDGNIFAYPVGKLYSGGFYISF